MSKLKYGYGWALKFLLAAILLGAGIYFFFAKEVVYTITGAAIILFSILRVIPLLKSLDKEVLRTINLIEIIFDVIIGAVLLYIALSGQLENNSDLWGKVYKYSLAFFFYIRGLVFFTSTTFFNEKTEVPKFVSHLIFLTIGTIIATHPDFDHGNVALFLSIISFTGTIYLGYDGYGGYKVYRQHAKALNEGKQKEIEKPEENQIEAPSKRKDQRDDDRPYIS